MAGRKKELASVSLPEVSIEDILQANTAEHTVYTLLKCIYLSLKVLSVNVFVLPRLN